MSELAWSQSAGQKEVLKRGELDLGNAHLAGSSRARVLARQVEALERTGEARSRVDAVRFWLWTQRVTRSTMDGVSVEKEFAANLRRLRQEAGLALDVLHELTGVCAPASLGTALIYDLRTMEVTREAVPRFADCPVCG